MLKKFRFQLVSLVIVVMLVIAFIPQANGNAPTDPDVRAAGLIPDTPETIAQDMISMSRSRLRASFPAVYDNSSMYPTPGDQAGQNSCVAWATAYGVKSYQENLERQWGVNSPSTQFSPSYMFNQIVVGNGTGCRISDAVRLVVDQGVTTLAQMPYNDRDYTTQPTTAQRANAAQYKGLGYGTVSMQTDAVKAAIQEFGGVIIGIPLYSDFDMLNTTNNQVFDSITGSPRGWHAVCLVGWDDSKNAFKLMNSWGSGWCQGGFSYISYNVVSGPYGVYGYAVSDKIDTQGGNAIPVISGAADKTINLGDTFNALTGVTAFDSEDGDLTAVMQVSGTVDTNTAGVYTLTYSVTDSGNATANVIRTISVFDPNDNSWEATKIYNTGDIVTYEGQTYLCKWWSQGNVPSNGGPWELQADSSDYVQGKAYSAGDVVIYQGVTYRAKWWTLAVPGTDNSWEII